VKYLLFALLIYSLCLSCRTSESPKTVEVTALSGAFNSILIVPCKLKQLPDGTYHLLTTGNEPVRNFDFQLVAFTGSFNRDEVKKSALYNKENAEIGEFMELVKNTDQSAGSYPEQEQQITAEFKKNTKSSGKVQIPYRVEGVNDLKITSLEAWLGLPPGSDITGQGYLFDGFPPQIIAAETKQLLYGHGKRPNYSPVYQGFGEIKSWLALKPAVPPMIRLALPMHSETYGAFSFYQLKRSITELFPIPVK